MYRPNSASKSNSFAILQLSGVWSFCTAITLIAVVCKFFRSIFKKVNPGIKHDVQRFNQWGEPSSYDIAIDGHAFRGDDHNLRKRKVSLVNEGEGL